MDPNIASYFNSPQITQAQGNVNTANQNVTNSLNAYNSWANGQPTFADNLKTAILNKFNNNQDLVNNDTQTLNALTNASQNARQTADQYLPNYNGIVDPTAKMNAMQDAYNNAYSNYSNAEQLLKQRSGNISDLVNAGGNVYQGYVNAANNAYKSAQEQQTQNQNYLGELYKNAQAQSAAQSAIDAAKIYASNYGGGSAASTPTTTPSQDAAALYDQWTQNVIKGAYGKGVTLANGDDTQSQIKNLQGFMNSSLYGELNPDEKTAEQNELNALKAQWAAANKAKLPTTPVRQTPNDIAPKIRAGNPGTFGNWLANSPLNPGWDIGTALGGINSILNL